MKLAVNTPSLVLNHGKVAWSSRPLNLNHAMWHCQHSWHLEALEPRESLGEQERE